MDKIKKPSKPSAAEVVASLNRIEQRLNEIFELVKPPDPDEVEASSAIDDLIDSIGRADD